ncbi:hypothetical protein TWF192_007186 [Orbilia oligospora]|nr:hypothetical protein TWF192_007186 [Orbilia oligospora]
MPTPQNENARVGDQDAELGATSLEDPLHVARGQIERNTNDASPERPSLISNPGDGRDGILEESPTRQQYNEETGESTKSSILDKLPYWITERLTIRDVKILFRAALAAWASFLFVVIHPILKNFGTEAFMGMLCLFINPASVMVPIYILTASTILIGILLAWAWGTLTFLAALSCRDDEVYNATYAAILQAASQSSHPSLYVQRQIFNGELLQTPVTAVIFVMCNIFIYFMARLRAAFPKFILVYIFGLIVIDVYITTGPLSNSFQGLLPLVFVKPLTSSIAIGLVLSLVVFPESCSYATLVTLSKSLGHACEILKITRSMLQEGGINKRIPVQEINVLKRKIIEAQTLAKQQFTFIEIEPSIGQWSGGDIKHLQEGFQDLFVNGIVLLNFHLLRQEYRSKVQRNAPKDPAVSYPYSFSLNNHKPRKDPYRRNSEAQTLASTAIYEFLKPEPESGKLEQAAFDEMGNLSQDLLDHDAVITSMKIIDSANNRKWFTSPKKSNMDVIVEQHTQALDKLKNQRERFQLRIVDRMIDPASHFFDAEGKFIHSSDGCVKILGLVVGMNYRHRIMAFTASLVNLLEHLIQLESEKSKVKFWMPVALKSLFSVAISPEPVYDDNALEKTQKIFEKKEGKLKGQKEKKGRKEKSTAQRTRGKSAKTYNNRYQQQRPRNKIVRALTSLYHWVTNSDGAFAARVVIATLILTIPGATKPGAKFCYDNRAIWAVITAQLSLAQFMGDFVFSVAMRFLGTLIGGVVGLGAWYIGAGSGPGNSYGIMAILVPCVIIGMAFRIWAPQEWMIPTLMGVATLMLVLGDSWETNYLPGLLYQAPGYGVFYHRLLLVLVGFGVAILVQVFPCPPSATRNASKSLAVVSSHITSFYADTVSDFLTKPEGAEYRAACGIRNERLTQLLTEIDALVPRIKMVKFEPSSSPFICSILLEIETCLSRILESLSTIAFVLPRLTGTYKRILEAQTYFVETETVASIIAALTALEETLRGGQPLSDVLPVPLLQNLRKIAVPPNGIGAHEFSRDILKNDDWSSFLVALMAVASLYSRIDSLVITVKEAVGEKYHVEGLLSISPEPIRSGHDIVLSHQV